jgi:hypothetical protein
MELTSSKILMKIDYQPFVVNEVSFDVVTLVVFIVIAVVDATLSICLGKNMAIGTTIAVMTTILTMILKIIHNVFVRTITSLK